MKVSLIIPTYKREELLVQTLECALKQDVTDYEILVIDQTPEHAVKTTEFLAAYPGRIKLVHLSKPSVTHARNEGLLQATGDILVFVDDDTSFESGFLAAHCDAHLAGADIVQGRVIEGNSRPASHPTWLSHTLKFTGGDNCDKDGITNNITGCNFSINRKVVNTIGYFDEHFRGISVREESDYARRAWNAGLHFFFSARAALFHHRSPSGGVTSGIRNALFDESYYYCEFLFCKKHFPRWVQFLYRVRLYRRGKRMLRRLIRAAEAEAERVLQPKEKTRF
ncbi:MAG: glycosyltransferase family 2 protein [Gammaproteobacteria bacterium]